MEQVHRYMVSWSYNAMTSGQKLIYGIVLVGWDIAMNPFYISCSPKLDLSEVLHDPLAWFPSIHI